MLELNKQVCSLELAKRLKELNVKQESELMWVCDTETEKYKIVASPISVFYRHLTNFWCSGDRFPDKQWYSSFTVAELGEMLPEFRDGEYMDIHKEGSNWVCGYECHSFYIEKTMADAMAKMLIYLIENGLCQV